MSIAVVCSHFNPEKYHAPRRNLLRFLRHLNTLNIPVFVAELAYDDDEFFVPTEFNSFRYRTTRHHTLWHKENLINLAVNQLPAVYDKVAWVDPDIWFMNASWFPQADAALDDIAAVQLFSDCAWTDIDGRLLYQKKSCASQNSLDLMQYHPGFAWAARRDLWLKGGGLCDRAIVGGADNFFMATCLGASLPHDFCYPDWERWLQPAAHWISSNGGYGHINGLIVHEWHGDKAKRNYLSRHDILRDVVVDSILQVRDDGILQFSPAAPPDLRQRIAEHFKNRSEDGI